jgi:hypothetical protein
MEDRRRFLQPDLASPGLVVLGTAEGPIEFGINTVCQPDLPAVSLDGWQVTAFELTYPPGVASPKHVHPGFVLATFDREFRLRMEGEPETHCRAVKCSMKHPASPPAVQWKRNQASKASRACIAAKKGRR